MGSTAGASVMALLRRACAVFLAVGVLAGCGSSTRSSSGPTSALARRHPTTTTTATPYPPLVPTSEEPVTPSTATPPATTPGPQPTNLGCGTERWDVKTGTDVGAASVNLAPQDSTIVALDAFASDLPQSREAPVETTVYRIAATVTVDKEEADSDIHMVLDDGAGHQMIGEIPDPTCVGVTSPFYRQIVAARAAFDAKFPQSQQFAVVDAHATLTGVGFFDKPHGQRGMAPNAVELHPVLSITFG